MIISKRLQSNSTLYISKNHLQPQIESNSIGLPQEIYLKLGAGGKGPFC